MSDARALRLDALIGKRVVDTDGRSYGRVREIEMDDDVDPPTVASLLAGSAAVIIRLGLRGWVRRFVRQRFRAHVVPWTSIEEIGAEIRVREAPKRWD